MGKYLLNSRDIECKWQPTDNTKTVALIKKRLAANQTLIAYKNKVKAFDSFQVKVPLKAKTLGKQFKATGGRITIRKNDVKLDFIFEAIRREEEWEDKLIEKMKLYKDFYENFEPMDSGFMQMPQLILLCEDERHMAEAFKVIVMNQLEIPHLNLYYTTDLRQNAENLSHSLVRFILDEETQKYKATEGEVKLFE